MNIFKAKHKNIGIFGSVVGTLGMTFEQRFFTLFFTLASNGTLNLQVMN
jgi:hypothetical protein